jgi:hypothetical protein
MTAILNKHNPFDHFQKLVIYLSCEFQVSQTDNSIIQDSSSKILAIWISRPQFFPFAVISLTCLLCYPISSTLAAVCLSVKTKPESNGRTLLWLYICWPEEVNVFLLERTWYHLWHRL